LPLLSRRAVWGDGLVVPTVCAANVSLVGVKSNDPPVSTPFPVTVIPWVTGLPNRSALSVMAISSVWGPTERGSKIIWMVQVPPPPATEVPQVLVCRKSPPAVIPLIFNAALPSLVSVTVVGLVVGLPTG